MPSAVAQRIKRGLARTNFPGRGVALRYAYRVYERTLVWREAAAARRSSAPRPPAGDLPLPPLALRVLTVKNGDSDFFLASGRADVALIREMLDHGGVAPGSLESVLDFGCGCGRLARWWLERGGVGVYGCDYNPLLVDWCRDNLRGLTMIQNRLAPPVAYPGDRFDLIYALSVFTHLGADLQRRWLGEWKRLLRPDGRIFLTVSGAATLYRLSADEQAAFRAGELVERFTDAPGSNVCEVYHPRPYVERLAAEHGLAIVDAVDAADPRSPATQAQDAYLLRPA